LHLPSRLKKQTASEQLLFLVSGEWVTKSIHTAIELAIADYLTEGPKSIQKLAQLTQCHEESLYRLLHMLASLGVFHEGLSNL
jgi:hypothetical protein